MTYLALARKYRPNQFDEIAGQPHVTRALTHAIERGRIHHAWLFCGARGVGKTTAARALARALNCEQGPTAHPCGTCAACREMDAGTSADLIEIDGASNNGVDDIRRLRETVHYPPQRRYKVYLIDEVHMLSRAAFNAMLKTLEEPPPHVLFIFATTEPGQIPDTILSRVLRFDFKRIGLDVIARHLYKIAQAEGLHVTDGALRLVARAAEGSMRDAQSHFDKVIGIAGEHIDESVVTEALGLVDREIVTRLVRAMLDGDAGGALAQIALVHDYGLEMTALCDAVLETLHHATLWQLGEQARTSLDLSDGEKTALEALVEGQDPERLSRLFSVMLDTTDTIARSERPRLVLEVAIARLTTVQPAIPMTEIAAKLEALERRLSQGRPPPGARGPSPSVRPSPRHARAPVHRDREPQSTALSHGVRPAPAQALPSDAAQEALRNHPAIVRLLSVFPDAELISLTPASDAQSQEKPQ